MKYISTRAIDFHSTFSFSNILLQGLAPDGGLFMPQIYPKITLAQLIHFRKLNYAQLAAEILSLFCDDIPRHIIDTITEKTYNAKRFAYTRYTENAQEITPLSYLGSQQNAPLYLLALSNGPTLAFKDIAMQLLGYLFEYILDKQKQKLNIVGATSGDTGSAAAYAMLDKKNMQLFMLSPQNRMSAFQQAQMYSLNYPHIYNLAIEGVFDDCQDCIKTIFQKTAFKEKHHLGAVNSINWGRLVAQIVYYFKGYLSAISDADWQQCIQNNRIENLPKVSFTVPSGNFGNACAGHIARMMGLPIDKIIVATNENDVLDEFFKTGIYRPRSAEKTWLTSSPSMDISKASNLERFLFDLFQRDSQAFKDALAAYKKTGVIDCKGYFDKGEFNTFGIVSGSSCHQARIETIRYAKQNYNRILDPHTANGLNVAKLYLKPEQAMIILETAQACKFPNIIREAIGEMPSRPKALENIEDLPQSVYYLPADAKLIEQFIAKHCHD